VPAIAQQLGDMTSITRGVGAADGGDQLAMAEAIRLESETLWAELAQSTDGPLERLLIDRLVTCPLHLEYAEAATLGRSTGRTSSGPTRISGGSTARNGGTCSLSARWLRSDGSPCRLSRSMSPRPG
jgi:hypothetical protein